MNHTIFRRGGGGTRGSINVGPSVKLFSAIVAIIVAISFLPLNTYYADSNLIGDGTKDNPYSGTIAKLDQFAYYDIGTTFDVHLPISNVTITPGFGLTLSNGHLTGTLTSGGICLIDEWNTIDYNPEHHWAINVPCLFENGTATNPVAGDIYYTVQISSIEEIYPFVSRVNYGGCEYSELEWTIDGGKYVLELNNLDQSTMDYWSTLQELSIRGNFAFNIVELISIDYNEMSIIVSLNFLDSSIIALPSLVPTYFVVDDRIAWKIFEVEECYDSSAHYGIPTPTKDGFIFTGWYEDPECTVSWTMLTLSDWSDPDFVNQFDPARYLYAGWEPNPSAISNLEFLSDPSEGNIQYVGA